MYSAENTPIGSGMKCVGGQLYFLEDGVES